MKNAKNRFRNSCGGQGCRISIILPHDSRIGAIFSRMSQISNDIQKVLPLANLPLQKKLAKKAQMEKVLS